MCDAERKTVCVVTQTGQVITVVEASLSLWDFLRLPQEIDRGVTDVGSVGIDEVACLA